MGLRSSVLKVIAAIPGAWEVGAAYIGMSTSALHNRAYHVKGQFLSVEHQIALQSLSGTTHFAEAVAAASGGVFLRLPHGDVDGKEQLIEKFNRLYVELGTFSKDFSSATADDEIDEKERACLQADALRMHKALAELVALSFTVYCRPSSEAAQ